jgi:hypothetical protein
MHEPGFSAVTPLLAALSRISVNDFVNRNVSLFCYLFLKLKNFGNHMITSAKNNNFSGRYDNFSLRDWQPW